jgi:tetratricopeptide (TPR) repeat protein
MGVDSRNDHSFRLPRPDISVKMPEIPNACNLCHKDKDAKWATEMMKKWYGKIPVGHQNFAHPMQSLRQNSADAPEGLYRVLMSDAPDIAKATVAGYLGNYPSKQTYTTTLQLLRNSDGTIRLSALRSLEYFPPKMRIKETFKMLNDPLKTVRTEAARQLSSFPMGQLDEKNKIALKKAIEEYKKTLLFNADRPESQLALAQLYSNQKRAKEAEEAYGEALRLQPMFAPATINYSDFLKRAGRDREAYEILQKGLKVLPDIAALHYSLGLWYVRNKESEKALAELKRAVELDEDDARFSYVYAVALGEKKPKEGIRVLEAIYPRHTGDREIVGALAYYYRQVGDIERSSEYEKILKSLQNFSVR